MLKKRKKLRKSAPRKRGREELAKEDPPIEEARAILEAEAETEEIIESGDEDTEGDDGE